MVFNKESEFEQALIDLLVNSGWSGGVIKNPTEQQLIQNWADILYENNRGIDRLNDYPLTKSEMEQILEQINDLKTPLRLNGFINGGNAEWFSCFLQPAHSFPVKSFPEPCPDASWLHISSDKPSLSH